MSLLTREDLRRLPPLMSQEGKGLDAVAFVKVFSPAGRYTLFITEAGPASGESTDTILFGWCVSPLVPGFDEFGYSSLRELESVRVAVVPGGPRVLPLERDRWFMPVPLREALREAGAPAPERTPPLDTAQGRV